jgi:hypothetical protein
MEETPQSIVESIQRKSEKSGISQDILEKVYLRGYEAWHEDCTKKDSVDADQWAYRRLNSFMGNGLAREYDADLWEEHIGRINEIPTEIDNEFQDVLEGV